MPTLFADLALARRIDRAEASLSSDIAAAVVRRRSADRPFSRALGDGVAVFTGVGSPMTKVIGVGFAGAPPEPALASVEADYAARGSAVRFEVSTLADPALVKLLTGRGYQLIGFENVLGRSLGTLLDDAPRPPEGLEIIPSQDTAAWMTVLIDAFAVPDTGVASTLGETFPRDALEGIYGDMSEAGGFRGYLARLHGELAGGATLRVCEGVAQLCGAATLPRFRRRGIQTAMLFERLRIASREGCDIAVVTAEPGSKSHQNAQRAGFALLYSRAILVN